MNHSFIFPYANCSIALGTLCHCVIAGLVALFLPEEMQPGFISAVVALPCLTRLLVFFLKDAEREWGGEKKSKLAYARHLGPFGVI